jgi:8-amino-7-oxononanoate synthase
MGFAAVMNEFDSELCERLTALHAEGLQRELRQVDSAQMPRILLEGKPLLNFSSNDYLGLANHPALKEAAIQAVDRYGAGSGASRLICGSLKPHHELEESLAEFKGTKAALSFSSGYAAALGTICALMGTNDIIILDKLVHACIVDAARLCGAKLRVFPHNDLNDLEDRLRWADGKSPATGDLVRKARPRVLIVTESVFSMDGDHAPLRQMVELKNKYGAWLMVDEAHATGLYGANRRGLAEEHGVQRDIEVQMGTLGKALGAAGGYICGSKCLIDYLVNKARSFIFSTAPVPAAVAAASAGVRLVQSAVGEERRGELWERVSLLRPGITNHLSNERSAIIPIHIGEETKTVETAQALRQRGIFIPAIRHPTVARGQARLRVTLTATHTKQEVERLRAALAAVKREATI